MYSPDSLAYSPSLDSIDSSPLSLAIDHGTRMDGVYSKSTNSSPILRGHERYYFSDGNVIFLVEGILYNVHRYFFMRDSPSFAYMLHLPFGGRRQGLDDDPIPLDNIKARDFDLFLSILYPEEFGLFAASNVQEWSVILQLATKWKFRSIRALAIKELDPITSPIDKIVLGRKYKIDEWLEDAYRTVCNRQDPLTIEEGERLGLEQVIKISAFIIIQLSSHTRSPPSNGQLQRHFGLISQVLQPPHNAQDTDAQVQMSDPAVREYVSADNPVEGEIVPVATSSLHEILEVEIGSSVQGKEYAVVQTEYDGEEVGLSGTPLTVKQKKVSRHRKVLKREAMKQLARSTDRDRSIKLQQED